MSAIPKNAQTNNQDVEDVLLLTDPELWNSFRFRRKLIESLERESFDPRAIELVEAVFDSASTPTFDAFSEAVESYIETASCSDADATAVRAVVSNWKVVRTFNKSIYRPRSKEDYWKRYWPNNQKNLRTKWEYYQDIHEMDLFFDEKRFITKDTPIASAGSCFAANISRQLQHWDYNYILEMGHPKEHFEDPLDYETDPARCGNIYNVVSMRQMVERAFGEWVPEQILVSTRPKFMDPFRAATDCDSLESYQERWTGHNEALSRALRKCEVFILTLGMTEAWVFADSELATSTSPIFGDATLVRHRNLTVEDNVRELERIYELFAKHNPEAKIITTVSPVPLNSTFNKDQHVVVANGLSKSILRVALEQFSQAHPENVYYFPSYEIVTMGTRDPWEIDARHVSAAAVERAMRQFQRQFLVSQEEMEIIQTSSVEELVDTNRSYGLRYLREWIVHPIKRALGIEGQPFSNLFRPDNR